jgi:hypothetical protein
VTSSPRPRGIARDVTEGCRLLARSSRMHPHRPARRTVRGEGRDDGGRGAMLVARGLVPSRSVVAPHSAVLHARAAFGTAFSSRQWTCPVPAGNVIRPEVPPQALACLSPIRAVWEASADLCLPADAIVTTTAGLGPRFRHRVRRCAHPWIAPADLARGTSICDRDQVPDDRP